MRALTTTQLSRMQDANESAMWDTCYLVTRLAGALDAYGIPEEQWVQAASSTVCGLDLRSSREVLYNSTVWLYDARLRLPIDTDITNLDRIKVTHRHGVELDTPLVFEIIGQPRRGPQGLLLELKTLTDGSVT